MPVNEYTVLPVTKQFPLNGDWDGTVWGDVPFVEIARFRPESSAHRPVTRVKLLNGPNGIYGIFQVKDRYIRCIRSRFQDEVYKDSCVEFFVQPKPGSGYFNFEFNCGGALLASYITDPEKTKKGFKDFIRLTSEERKQILIYHSMPEIVEPEITDSMIWHIEFFIPYSVFESHTGSFRPQKGDTWRANFFKCGDETSHPHWGAWSPVETLNFHLPRCFGVLKF
ncbi:MAG: carbohydrate-binding family 9-like protein [Desulfobacterales bacterium]|nr:carbohydrate-binding family 9-like protein [Desulfobacterales bacterium]